MSALCSRGGARECTDAELVARLPTLVQAERHAMADVIEHFTEDNAEMLLNGARGKSRRQLEELIARWFPRPDVPPSLTPVSPEPAKPAKPAGVEQLLLGDAPPSVTPAGHATCSGTPGQVSLPERGSSRCRPRA